PTDASGVATVVFRVTRQPGDNFAIAAGLDPTAVNAVNVNGIELTDGASQNLATENCPTQSLCRSQMLTVWRRVHIEVDSMGQAQQNFVLGTVTTTTRMRSHETVTLPLSPSPASPLEVNRFEGGRIVINGRSYPVSCNIAGGDTCNTENSVTINNPFGTLTTVFAGTQFQLFDDDDFNDDDGANMDGDTLPSPGEDVPEPDTSMVTAGSDDPATNVFAQAYVRPVYDIVNTHNNSIFQANTAGGFQTDLRPLFVDRDSTSTNADPEFWTVYILGSYQHTLSRDNDPSTESAVRGIVDAITGDTSGGSDGEGSGALIFVEVHRVHEIDDPGPFVNERHTVAHELGHLFSGQHTPDGGLMGFPIASDFFSPITINKIRGIAHP
ncbi:MAG: hypothetical protein ACRD43_04105, partial [Pyrinomonadaceae bacterium]